MGIKGHAVIELRNEVTGEVQKVEHDNMVTRGLEYCMTPWFGKFNFASTGSSPQYLVGENENTRKTYNRSMMDHLLGGIFLFSNKLEEDVNNVAFPPDNPLTGKASYNLYGGMDTYRGSHNDNESGMQEDGSYKHVWDFTTSQANGQISALALTTWKGGICGCGYKNWDYSLEANIAESPVIELGRIKINKIETNYFFPFIKVDTNEVFWAREEYNLSYYNYNGNAEKHLSISKKLNLKKKKIPLNKISPFYDYYNQYLEEEVEVTVPDEFAGYANCASCSGKPSDSYVYVYKKEIIGSGKIFKLMRVKKDDLSVDVVTITNSTPYSIDMTGSMIFTDTFLFALGGGAEGTGYRYRLGLENGDIVVARGRINASYTLIQVKIINGYLYETFNNNRTYCINTDTLVGHEHPCYNVTSSNETIYSDEKINPIVYLHFKKKYYGVNNNGTEAEVSILANTLMTINNLSSPVVKTAAQTMKITYTITEA